MRIEFTRPPNFARIASALPGALGPRVVFAYGDVIHNPNGLRLDTWIVAHEEIHGRQQRGASPDVWWDLYIESPAFRFRQELEAHRAEWVCWQGAHYHTRHARLAFISRLASRLSGPLYGGLVDHKEARRLILTPESVDDERAQRLHARDALDKTLSRRP